MKKSDRRMLGLVIGLLFLISLIGMIFTKLVGPTWASFFSSIGAGCITSFIFLIVTNRREAEKEENKQVQSLCDKLMAQFIKFIDSKSELESDCSEEEINKHIQEIVYYGVSWFSIYDDLIKESDTVKSFFIKANCADRDMKTEARKALANLDSFVIRLEYDHAAIMEQIQILLRFICLITCNAQECVQMIEHDAWENRRKIF